MTESTFHNTTFLDTGMAELLAGEDVAETIGMIIAELHTLRTSLSQEDWKEFTTIACHHHPIMELLHQDPYSWRCFFKPRGYGGDAETLDFLYAVEDGFALPALEQCSILGRRIYDWIVYTEPARAVRARRRIVIERLNALVASRQKPHVMSMACGHLREAKGCSAFLAGEFGRYVAVDHDKESLAVVEREVGSFGVETVQASVRNVLKEEVSLSGFDFIYATGLYDYLALPAAQRLTQLLFGMLNPGGKLLIANFIASSKYAGYMEACLDWWLVYRTKPELLQVAETLLDEQIENIVLFVEENNNIIVMEIVRKG
jgi:extracellular factor (EF) 3-hydroxypalmitic acid methyl ester biosynthesis protein